MDGRTLGTVLFMTLTWAGVIALTVFCFLKVLRGGDKPK